jgi:hypothetical protein
VNNEHTHGTEAYVLPIFSLTTGAAGAAQFGGCTDRRKGMLVWIPQNYISATSYHSRQQFASVEGSILWEYVEGDTSHRILVVDFGGNDRAVHVGEAHCRFHVDPKPSVGGILEEDSVHYGELSGGLYDTDRMPFDWSPSGNTELVGAPTPRHAEGRADEIRFAGQNWNRKMPDYEESVKPVQECALTLGMQDSTTETPFPKVQVSLPPYLADCSKSYFSRISDTGSSGSKWLGPLEHDDNFSECTSSSEDSADFHDLDEDTFCNELDDETIKN